MEENKDNPIAKEAASTSDSASEENDGKAKKEIKEPPSPMVGPLEIYRFASITDKLYMIFGTLSAIIHGSGLPLMIIIFGETIGSFSDFALQSNLENANTNVDNLTAAEQAIIDQRIKDKLANISSGGIPIIEEIRDMAYYFTGIGAGVFVFGFLQLACWQLAAENQTLRIRTTFFRSILRQNIAWFDDTQVGEMTPRLTDDINNIKDGFGAKIGTLIQWVAGCITGMVIGFVYGWKLSLVILAVSPLLMVAGYLATQMVSSFTAEELESYAKAGAVAEQAFGAIRTVTAFAGQEKECARYEARLGEAQKTGIKKGFASGAAMGVTYFIMFLSYALAFWYGSSLVRAGEYDPEDLLIVFFSILIASFSLGNAGPNVTAFAQARGAAHAVFSIIDRQPPIDVFDDAGQDNLSASSPGSITFEDVSFSYPSRPEVPILRGFDIHVEKGQTIALVGPSGCGKSTVVQLLQRFYDVDGGTVRVGGRNVRDYSVRDLRSHFGMVGQEPALFDLTIEENIRLGSSKEEVTTEDIVRAAKEANAHDFISNLPEKYKTLVGGRGAQLSGGQKQRIAIARALVRNPEFLLLDEATSALDTESEKVVQAALDKVSEGRTTIVIAHRLSTIRNASVIASVRDGVVEEFGTHDELMKREGLYHDLVTSQLLGKEEELAEEMEAKRLEREDARRSFRKSFRRSVRRSMRKRKMSVKALSVDEETGAVEEEVDEDEGEPDMIRLWKMNLPEWPYLIVGFVCAMISGAVQPAFAVVFAEVLLVFTELEDQEGRANFWSTMFIVLGVAAGIAMLLKAGLLGIAGERLTTRLRGGAFRHLLGQEIAYFDNKHNSTGALCARLATDASLAKGATGPQLGMYLQILANMGTALIIAFYFGWQLTLVILAFIPFIALGGYFYWRLMAGGTKTDKEALEKSSQIAMEAVENMRTVASLQKEEYFYRKYCTTLAETHKKAQKASLLYGLSFGFSQAVIFFSYAAAFTMGAWLVENGHTDFEGVMKVFTALIFGAMAIGEASSTTPDAVKAKSASGRIFGLLNRRSLIDPYAEGVGKKPETINGAVTFESAKFHYPSRPGVKVLRGIDFSVVPDTVVALVGGSGCGKSTCIQLLERFYDCVVDSEGDAGRVALDGESLKDLDVRWLREQLGLVSQEPVLFEGSIAENIKYGDNSRADIPIEEVVEAAKKANIHDFVSGLPLGYETNVGEKGAQLSGGQKQRVAIARALIRNPKILLLDEATSALDNESEKLVQEALEAAQVGRTTLVIAHRLSTIQSADRILVIQDGVVVESGKHPELMAKKGHYWSLQNSNVVL